MATTITEVPTTQGLLKATPIRWCLNITSTDLSTSTVFKAAEAEKKHWIEQISITPLSGGTEWVKIFDGTDILIGPMVLADGVPWTYKFHRAIHGSENTDLKIQTKSAFNLHVFIEGYTDAYPTLAYNPSPSDGATGVSTTADLSWSAAPQVTNYDVYFGTSTPPSFIGNQAGATYDPGTMDAATTYYWRIDVSDGGPMEAGDTWTFST